MISQEIKRFLLIKFIFSVYNFRLKKTFQQKSNLIITTMI